MHNPEKMWIMSFWHIFDIFSFKKETCPKVLVLRSTIEMKDAATLVHNSELTYNLDSEPTWAGRSVSPPAGRTPAKGAYVGSSDMFKYLNCPLQRLCRRKD